MKAEIHKDGCIHVIAETVVEAFALNQIAPNSNVCPECDQMKIPLLVDCSILIDHEEKGDTPGGNRGDITS